MHKSVSTIVSDDVFVQIRGFSHPLALKLESLNPAGSVKVKTAQGLIESARRRGLINRNTVFIESSSGNLGVALAMICAEKGYAFTCVIDPNCSPQNEATIRAYGARVVKVTERDENGGYLGTRLAYIRAALAANPDCHWLNQYENRANPDVHSRRTAAAIDAKFDRIDYLFVGAGTTGTLMGCLAYLRRHRPETAVVAVDSIGSITFGTPAGPRHIPGLGTSSRPPILDPEGLTAVEMVPEARTVLMCRHLTRTQGLLVGGSTGTVLAGVHAWRDRIASDAVVVAISPDWGERYLDTVYNDDWARARFGERVLAGDLGAMEAFAGRTLRFEPAAPLPMPPHARPAANLLAVPYGSTPAAGALSETPVPRGLLRACSSQRSDGFMLPSSSAFHVISGKAIADILEGAGPKLIEIVRTAYVDHDAGRTHNPDSYFLRFADAPANRIIALPATLGTGCEGLSGIKWISSFPGNVAKGMQRASAVLVLNRADTGYPFALLEASRISAARTAASAVLGAFHLAGERRQSPSIAFVGGGIIARTILNVFMADGWRFGTLLIADTDPATARAFSEQAEARHGLTVAEQSVEAALDAAIVVLATTAPRPYITGNPFRPGQIVLNISLRDLGPEIIAGANNILDDIEHCLKADTSPDLAVRAYGRRDFLTGTLAELMAGTVRLNPQKPSIFSPFGLGVLDLAVGAWVYETAQARGTAASIDDFLFAMER